MASGKGDSLGVSPSADDKAILAQILAAEDDEPETKQVPAAKSEASSASSSVQPSAAANLSPHAPSDSPKQEKLFPPQESVMADTALLSKIMSMADEDEPGDSTGDKAAESGNAEKKEKKEPTLASLLNDDDDEAIEEKVPPAPEQRKEIVSSQKSSSSAVNVSPPANASSAVSPSFASSSQQPSSPTSKKQEAPEIDPLDLMGTAENQKLMADPLLSASSVTSTVVISRGGDPIRRMTYAQLKEIGKLLSVFKNPAEVGTPTCIQQFGNNIYIGNTKGVIRVFDFNETEGRAISIKESAQSRVISMDIHPANSFLAVGFQNGVIMLWDIKAKAVFKIVAGYHQTTVLGIKFIHGDLLRTVSSDMNGCIYITNWNDRPAKVQLLLQNRIGFSLCPVFPDVRYESKINDMSLIAIGDVSAVCVLSIDPELKMLWECKRHEKLKHWIPYITWGHGALPDDPENTNLILAIAWEKVIQLVSIRDPCIREEGYEWNGFYVSSHEIISIQWIAESVLIFFNAINEATILHTGSFQPGRYNEKNAIYIRPSDKKEHIEQCYKLDNDELYKQVYTFGKTSASDGGAGEPIRRDTYHQTIIAKDALVIALTRNGVLKGQLLSYSDYLNALKQKSKWIQALNVCLGIYSGSIKGFAELPSQKTYREDTVRAFMKTFILGILMELLEGSQVSSGGAMESPIKKHEMEAIIEFCISIGSVKFLVRELLDLFKDYNLETVFINSLEKYILSGAFREAIMPNNIIEQFVASYTDFPKNDLYDAKKKCETLEKLVLNLKFDSSHEETVLLLTKKATDHKMFSALIYLKSLEIFDRHYSEPAIHMLAEFSQQIHQRSSDSLRKYMESPESAKESVEYLGYKILWYLRLCFTGTKYPPKTGDTERKILLEEWPGVIYQLLQLLVTEFSGSSHMKDLLTFDFKATLKVIGILFENSPQKDYVIHPEKYPDKAIKGFHYVDIIERVSEIASKIPTLKSDDKFYLLKFIAKVCASPELSLPVKLCVKVVTQLAAISKELSHTEKDKKENEKKMLCLLSNCPELRKDTKSLDQLLNIFIQTTYYEIVIFIRDNQGDYIKCLETYLNTKDKELGIKVFYWLQKLRMLAESKPELLEEMKNQLRDKLEQLLALDVSQTAEMVDAWFEKEQDKIIDKLKATPSLQLELLSKVLKDKESEIEAMLRDEDFKNADEDDRRRYAKLLELNIQLLCQLKPVEVVGALKKKYYPSKECLDICIAHKHDPAIAYLQKRLGEFQQSIVTYIKILKEHAEKIASPKYAAKLEENCNDFMEYFNSALKVCEKHAKVTKNDESEQELWFQYLDALYNLWQDYYKQRGVEESKIIVVLNDCIKKLLTAMMAHITFRTILERVTNTYGNLEIEVFKELFASMLFSYTYQAKILDSATHIFANNTMSEFLSLLHHRSRALAIDGYYCAKCSKTLAEKVSEDGNSVFPCGHMFHGSCISNKEDGCEVCSKQGITQNALERLLLRDPAKEEKKLKKDSPTNKSGGLKKHGSREPKAEAEEEKKLPPGKARAEIASSPMSAKNRRIAEQKREKLMEKMMIFERGFKIKSFHIAMADAEKEIARVMKA